MAARRESLTSAQGLFVAEHRALRELHAAARHLATHWEALGRRLGGAAEAQLVRGSQAARELLEDLSARTAQHDLHGRPAAQGVGSTLAGLRGRLGDRLLERNQAVRLAALDVAHVVTLLGYLAELAGAREDERWAAFHRHWAERLAGAERDIRSAAAQLGRDPGLAVAPLDRAGHAMAVAIGTAGEAIDRVMAR